ncbi:MAG: ATP-dependent metallopeptidase FtsH/Yme1/Tma family protein, partial [Verrucomicrobia bacterium]|nr:ATP-dependent metallopeptidase FtsH/Yme1/Tma family protein [Verrucomicrobiota bacterium]
MKSPKNVQPDKDENRSGGDRPPRENPPWRFSMGYLGIALLVLMIWHGMMNVSGSRSIPYSEFKKHVDRGEVTECSISADMISGKIVPKTDNSASDTAKETSAAKTEPQQRGFLPKLFSKEPPKEGEPYDFSTVRVDNDKDLIEKLKKSGTQFVGNRPGFFEQ